VVLSGDVTTRMARYTVLNQTDPLAHHRPIRVPNEGIPADQMRPGPVDVVERVGSIHVGQLGCTGHLQVFVVFAFLVVFAC
jgi:hypothetical protein